MAKSIKPGGAKPMTVKAAGRIQGAEARRQGGGAKKGGFAARAQGAAAKKSIAGKK